MDAIHTWWSAMPAERYWLGITHHDARGEWLAAPCGSGRHTRTTGHVLITYVRDGDAVFHYDQEQQAIVAWSVARGRARKRPLGWSGRVTGGDSSSRTAAPQPSWVMGLEGPVSMAPVVTLEEIARVQWTLFPALRAFEDRVGEPLSYPFTIGHPTSTRLLPGYVFKLPELFVRALPALASVARRTGFAPQLLPVLGPTPPVFEPGRTEAAMK